MHYVKERRERCQRAGAVAVAGYSIETPRVLLNSTSPRFKELGLHGYSGRRKSQLVSQLRHLSVVTDESYSQRLSRDRPFRKGLEDLGAIDISSGIAEWGAVQCCT